MNSIQSHQPQHQKGIQNSRSEFQRLFVYVKTIYFSLANQNRKKLDVYQDQVFLPMFPFYK